MYIRKTKDEWWVMTNYGYGWECEAVCSSKNKAIQDARAYLENTNAQVRIEKHRVMKEG